MDSHFVFPNSTQRIHLYCARSRPFVLARSVPQAYHCGCWRAHPFFKSHLGRCPLLPDGDLLVEIHYVIMTEKQQLPHDGLITSKEVWLHVGTGSLGPTGR